MIQHYTLKQHVQLWIDENNIQDVNPVGLGKGHKGVELYLLKTTYNDFKLKYPMLETKYIKGWFTKSRYSDSKLYISIVKKK